MALSKHADKVGGRVLTMLLLLFSLVFLPAAAACGSPDLPEPGLPYSQSEALLSSGLEEASRLPLIPHYDLKLRIDTESATYEGSASIDYTNLEQVSLDSVFLRLFPNGGGTYGNGRLTVSAVKVDDISVDVLLSLDDTVLELDLQDPLFPGGQITKGRDFAGSVPLDFDGGGYGIYNMKDHVLSLAGWYPILSVYDDEGWNIDPVSSIGDSVYSDIAYYTVEVTAPAGMVHAATGSLVQEKQAEAGLFCAKYVSGPARDFYMVLGEDLVKKVKEVNGIMVNTYYLVGHEAEADMTLDIAEDSLKTFSNRFGPYPYKELDIVDVPMNGSVAVEFPGIVVVGSSVFGNAVFTSHEIAHQWWYNVVGNDVIDDPWIDEALTTYSSLIYYEFNRSGIEYNQVLDYFKHEYEKIKSSGSDDAVSEGLDYFEKLGGRHYSRIVYSKGAMFYHELRREIGDRAFFDALRDYYADMKYSIASADDLLDRFEEFSGRQLDDLYREWLY